MKGSGIVIDAFKLRARSNDAVLVTWNMVHVGRPNRSVTMEWPKEAMI